MMMATPASERGSLQSIAERIDRIGDLGDSADILREIRDVLGLANVVYLADRLPGRSSSEPVIAVTYPDDWVSHYKEQNFVAIDPVLSQGFRSIMPLDWADLDRSNPKARLLFNHAAEFGVGRRGLTFPIRGPGGERAVLSLTSNGGERDWYGFTKTMLGDLQILAFHIHEMILRVNGVPEDHPALSPRETECLVWISNGKTMADVGDILNISERTVRFHCDTARHKLHALHITQAVARAIYIGLIPPPLF